MTTALVRTNRHLVDEKQWNRLIYSIQKDHDVDRGLSERIMDQALGFLKLCAISNGRYSPSRFVDIGWHTFMLDSKAYTDWCDLHAGTYIHHYPLGENEGGSETGGVAATVAALKTHGIYVDEELWFGPGDCNNDGGGSLCYQGCMKQ